MPLSAGYFLWDLVVFSLLSAIFLRLCLPRLLCRIVENRVRTLDMARVLTECLSLPQEDSKKELEPLLYDEIYGKINILVSEKFPLLSPLIPPSLKKNIAQRILREIKEKIPFFFIEDKREQARRAGQVIRTGIKKYGTSYRREIPLYAFFFGFILSLIHYLMHSLLAYFWE